jgi:[histone H3]-dimethyl-L-lysine9 demethylase
MYNAFASSDETNSKGSTCLHMDMADAVNIMLFATPTADGSPGCAAWDIYRAEDASKIREFIKQFQKGTYTHDPIHSQNFYLDPDMRRRLYEQKGVKSWRIYQKPGDAVFIPAGCAHQVQWPTAFNTSLIDSDLTRLLLNCLSQVCNLSDCIKVACDFVSPENIDKCEMLTLEFREQNQMDMWKEDVLQLRSMMWFAWLSCRRLQKDAELKKVANQ